MAVIANGFDGAAFHSFLAQCLLGRALRLFEHVGITPIVVAGEVLWGRFAAQIAVDALVIHVEFTRDILRISVG